MLQKKDQIDGSLNFRFNKSGYHKTTDYYYNFQYKANNVKFQCIIHYASNTITSHQTLAHLPTDCYCLPNCSMGC